MNTMAIDASSKSTGIAIYTNGKLKYYECITATGDDALARIKKMVKRIRELYEEYNIKDVALEDVIPEDVRHNQNVFKILHYLQAAIILAMHDYKQNVTLYVSSEWRAACGITTGRGVKREILKAKSMKLVKDKYGIDVNDDISDAICLGWSHTHKPKNTAKKSLQEESAF